MAEVIPESKSTSGAATRRNEILRPSQIFDPVARALDVLGDRWTLVLVRQLLGGPKGFQELRNCCPPTFAECCRYGIYFSARFPRLLTHVGVPGPPACQT